MRHIAAKPFLEGVTLSKMKLERKIVWAVHAHVIGVLNFLRNGHGFTFAHGTDSLIFGEKSNLRSLREAHADGSKPDPPPHSQYSRKVQNSLPHFWSEKQGNWIQPCQLQLLIAGWWIESVRYPEARHFQILR